MLDLKRQTRRHFFESVGFSLGSAALASLTQGEAVAKGLQYPQKAKSDHLSVHGGRAVAPGHARLQAQAAKYNGQLFPDGFMKGQRFAFIKGVPRLLGRRITFRKCGKCGAEISELLPHLQANRRRHRHS